jgi:hypothetical protein
MDGNRFDDLARILSITHSRRRVLSVLAGGAVATVTNVILPRRVSADVCKERVPNPDFHPQPNGCGSSFPVPSTFGNVDITPACNSHDACYDTCKSSRHACDASFLADMKKRCSQGNTPGSTALTNCLGAADLYYRVVSSAGGSAYDQAQQNACICCNANERACGGVCCATGLCHSGECLKCAAGKELCGGKCRTACPAGFVRDAACRCVCPAGTTRCHATCCAGTCDPATGTCCGGLGQPCSGNGAGDCCRHDGVICGQASKCCISGRGFCNADGDCCSGHCDSVSGRCCAAPGDTCAAEHDCCQLGGATCGGGRCCFPAGTACHLHEECCNDHCDQTTQTCCAANGSTCSAIADCCNGGCDGGHCCTGHLLPCTGDGDCCAGGGDICPDGVCCRDVGKGCATVGDCCFAGDCKNGTCCLTDGLFCSHDAECCNGTCAGGVCQPRTHSCAGKGLFDSCDLINQNTCICAQDADGGLACFDANSPHCARTDQNGDCVFCSSDAECGGGLLCLQASDQLYRCFFPCGR